MENSLFIMNIGILSFIQLEDLRQSCLKLIIAYIVFYTGLSWNY